MPDFDDVIGLFNASDLSFDAKSPRLVEFDVGGREPAIIKTLWDVAAVKELVLSIAAGGYFRHEPMIVAREGGKNVVLDGNRRLAAVRLLLDPNAGVDEYVRAATPAVTDAVRESITQIPCMPSTRQGAWRHMAFNHINGPSKWSSYARARYIADVHRCYGEPLDEIARQVGDAYGVVRGLHSGFVVLEQAERIGAYQRDDRWHGHFVLSRLCSALQYPSVREFLGLRSNDDDNQDPVPVEKTAQLRDLLVWLYGSRSEKRPPIVHSQTSELRQLQAVLDDVEATAALRVSGRLEVAYETSRPSANVFEEALVSAKQSLEKARGALTTGYQDSKHLMGTAAGAEVLARDLHEEMRRKSGADGRTRRKPRRAAA